MPEARAVSTQGRCSRPSHIRLLNWVSFSARSSDREGKGAVPCSGKTSLNRMTFLRSVCGFESNDYFSSSVFLLEVADGLRQLTEPITPVDDRLYFAFLHEIAHDDQVCFLGFRQERDQFPASEPGKHESDQAAYDADRRAAGQVSRHDADPLRI